MIDGITLGGYALEPSAEVLATRADEWYSKLGAVEGAHGLEIPFRGGTLYPDGMPRLAELLPDGWHVVVTMLPPTMAGIRANPAYGLSSSDEEGRAAALADVNGVLAEAARLADATGYDTVRAIHLTSAPRGTGDAEQLARSLEQLAGVAGSVQLLVEHCDSWHSDRPVEKGFLSLDDEIAAVTEARANSGATFGQAINWGRSAIDERSADGARKHIAALRAAGTLGGVVFSGASATGGALGGAWADAHNPLDTVDPSSLLTKEEIATALTAQVFADLSVLGVKVLDPAKAEDFDAHLEPLRVTVAAVLDQVREISA